jgi:NTP pyrophosphatase (non-canonical NTP hydrolase)
MLTTEDAMKLARDERDWQNDKWGFPQHNTPFAWVSILTEEVGELAEAMNNAHMGAYASNDDSDVVREAIQVAAVALAIIEHLGIQERIDYYGRG